MSRSNDGVLLVNELEGSFSPRDKDELGAFPFMRIVNNETDTKFIKGFIEAPRDVEPRKRFQ